MCFPGRNQINDKINSHQKCWDLERETLDFTNILLKHKLSLMNSFKGEKTYFFLACILGKEKDNSKLGEVILKYVRKITGAII